MRGKARATLLIELVSEEQKKKGQITTGCERDQEI